MSFLRKALNLQIAWSSKLDQLLPDQFRIDGNQDFIHDFVTPYLRPGTVVYDVGGGKQPMISCALKVALGIRMIGLDISENELLSAPAGAYDAIICCDITQYAGNADGDVVICQALLEHVADVSEALRAINSILKPGGVALLFVPSAKAVYAKLNLMLPEELKRAILFRVFPKSSKAQGFRAYCDRCTPREMKMLAGKLGLLTEQSRVYYYGNYFAFVAPLYALWRAWLLTFYMINREQSAETFSMALRKPIEG